ncbi:MAG: hypothetical protein K5651_00480 [Bacteroidales bacterium]|nr:hypothetical protein [Bacteroidales bacterium]
MKPIHYISIGCIGASLIICAFFIGRVTAPSLIDGEWAADTVTKVVPMWKDSPSAQKSVLDGYIAVPQYKFISETVDRPVPVPYAVHDTTIRYIYLPREQKYYEEADGHLRMWVSGYDPCLDKYEWDAVTTTITQTYNAPKKHWGAGAAGGYGVTIFEGGVIHGPSASAFWFYNFNRFGLGISGELNTAAYNGGLLATPSVKAFCFYSW